MKHLKYFITFEGKLQDLENKIKDKLSDFEISNLKSLSNNSSIYFNWLLNIGSKMLDILAEKNIQIGFSSSQINENTKLNLLRQIFSTSFQNILDSIKTDFKDIDIACKGTCDDSYNGDDLFF